MTTTFTADETTAGRMASAFTKWQFRQPKVWLICLIILGAAVLLGFQHIYSFVAFAVTFLVLFPILTYRTAKKSLRPLSAAGTVVKVTVTDETIAIQAATFATKLNFSLFRSVAIQDGFVMIRQKNSNGCIVLPQELVPEATVTKIRSTLA